MGSIPLVQPPVVKQLEILVDDEGHDAVGKALLEHDKPTHAAVAVLEGMNALKSVVERHDVFKSFIRKGIVVRKQRLHLRCDLLGRRGFLSPDLIGKFLILPDAEPRAATVGGTRLENAVQLLDECFGQASGSSLVDYQVNAAEVVRSLDHIINVDRLIRNAQRIGLENMTSLLLREPAALDMVGVVGQLDLNTVVDAAPAACPSALSGC